MFRDEIECYQAIGTALATAADNPWASITAEIALEDCRVDAVVSYVDANTGATGYLAGVPGLANCFYELARLVSTPDKGHFRSCVFTLEPNGRFDVDFSYE